MNLWMQIMVIAMLGVITISSQAEDSFTSKHDRIRIPLGGCQGCIASKQKIEDVIASQFDMISTVSDFSFVVTGRSIFFNNAIWGASFTVQTTSNVTHENIICNALFNNKGRWWNRRYSTITLGGCQNEKAKLDNQIKIYLNHQGNIFPSDHRLYDSDDPQSVID